MEGRARAFLCAAALLAAPGVEAARGQDEPGQVTVQHILIGFKRSIPDKKVDRTKDEARALAEDLFERARTLTDPAAFGGLVAEFTDDSAPGIYVLVNEGQPVFAGARKRRDMVARFGDIAFSLEVGEVGLAAYHGGLCPYGWHVIKRLE